MNQFKRAQVIMLPTKDKSLIYNCEGKLLYDNKIIKYIPIWKDSHQHLYIISDDEIKVGDWCYDTQNYRIVKYSHKIAGLYFVKGIKHIKEGEGYSTEKEDLKKIIATTDTSLKEIIKNHNDFDSVFSYPQPSQQFIEKYIESYNKDEVITDVLVELKSSDLHYFNEDLRINPKDNTITIKKVKNIFTLEDMKSAFNAGMNCPIAGATFEEWIKINL